MADLDKQVQEALDRIERERAGGEDFVRLRDFASEMRRQGLLIKKEYDIPPLDTIGKTAFTKKEQ